jgi:predicted nucleotidyltransferase
MVKNRQQALEIAGIVRHRLQDIYGPRLRAVYLYGSAARDHLTPQSDIDIAVILDNITNRFEEHKRTSKLGSDISLENDTIVLFYFAEERDLQNDRFAIHRAIKKEGIPA